MGLDTSTDRSSTGGSDHDDRTVFRPWPVPPGRGRDHDPRSAYVERFWISTLGPSATWIMRRLADEFDANPDGFVIDVSELAGSLGMSWARRQDSPFGRALHRCVMFGLARPGRDGYEVRRRVPDLGARQIARLTPEMRSTHEQWLARTSTHDARAIADGLVSVGIDRRAASIAAELAALSA
ncbi:MAG: hypothetical protein ACO35E_03125 [Ilumatobacteraceae bacterium]|jgi:hypothetical protein